MIPKIIHQTFPVLEFGPNINKNLNRLRENNPGWEHRLYDDGDVRKFISTNYGKKILGAFDRINPSYGPARADLFRYLLIYKVGGVYRDIKSSFDRPIDKVLLKNDEYILCQWPLGVGGRYTELRHVPYGEYQQWHVIARPGHPFLKAVIDLVLENIDFYTLAKGVGKIGVLRTTGPIAYTQAIFPILLEHKHRFISYRESGIIYNVLSTTGYGQGHRNIFKKHYTSITEPVILPISKNEEKNEVILPHNEIPSPNLIHNFLKIKGAFKKFINTLL